MAESDDPAENTPETTVEPPKRRSPGRPFPPGVSGNPGGRPSTKPLTDALKKALAEPDEKTRRSNLEEIVRGLIAQAKKGKTDAAAMIFDRLEGKVLSEHKVTSRFEGVIQQLERLSESELEAFVAGGTLPAWFDVGGAEVPKA